MSCQDIEILLDAFVDDELSPAERERVERHLAECAACRRVEKETRALVTQTSKLPRGISPGRDLFGEVRERIEGRPTRVAPRHPSRVFVGRRWLGVAAAVIVVALAGVTALRVRNDSAPGAPSPTPTPAVVAAHLDRPARIDLAVQDYETAAELLLGAIQERRDRLSPKTLEVLDKNLAIIDQAIDEVRAALEEDPSNAGNALVLTAMHEQKVEFLRRVSRLAS